jgi:pyruvate,water dikinase
VRQLISDAAMPPEIANEIEKAYIKMGRGLVAVRSSATAEDLPEASFAG